MLMHATGGLFASPRAVGAADVNRVSVAMQPRRAASSQPRQVIVSVAALNQRDRTKVRCTTVLAKSRLSQTWRISDVDSESHCRIVPPESDTTDGYIELMTADGHLTMVELDWPLGEETLTRALNQAGNHVSLATQTDTNPRKSWVAALLGRSSQKPVLHSDAAAPDRARVSSFLDRFGFRKEKTPFNVLFVGPPASGKTTAIMSASTVPARTTEASATDDVATMKARTTISIDYGQCDIGHFAVRMFGTPGQLRFAHMIETTRRSADAAVLLIDMSSPDPLGDIVPYLDYLDGFGEAGGRPLLVGLTHVDRGQATRHFHAALSALLGKRAPVVPLDPRDRASVNRALTALSGLSAQAVAAV